MGRWSGTKYRLKGDQNLYVLTAYRPCSSLHHNLAYFQKQFVDHFVGVNSDPFSWYFLLRIHIILYFITKRASFTFFGWNIIFYANGAGVWNFLVSFASLTVSFCTCFWAPSFLSFNPHDLITFFPHTNLWLFVVTRRFLLCHHTPTSLVHCSNSSLKNWSNHWHAS